MHTYIYMCVYHIYILGVLLCASLCIHICIFFTKQYTLYRLVHIIYNASCYQIDSKVIIYDTNNVDSCD